MRNKFTIIYLLFFLVNLVAANLFAGDQKSEKYPLKKETVQKLLTKSALTGREADLIKENYQAMKERRDQLQARLKKSIAKTAVAESLQKKAVRTLTKTDRIRAFMLGVEKMKAQGATSQEIFTAIQQRLSLRKIAQTGSVSGKITTGGILPVTDAMVYAFDRYGFPAGQGLTGFDGSYTIAPLPAGEYYIVTESDYADEFYDDVFLNDFENWRQATKVNVTENGQVSNIDFDLSSGGVITGTISDQGTGLPLAYGVVFMSIYSTTDPSNPLAEKTLFTDDKGQYSIVVGDVAGYKLSVMVPGYKPEFYNDKPDWGSADPVVIPALGDTVKNVDFALEQGSIQPPAPEGNVIAGTVMSQLDNSPLNFVLVFAFDLSDTSIAGFGLSGVPSIGSTMQKAAVPNYFITGLPQGSFIVVATDLFQGYNREFYEEATNPADAKPITFSTDTDTAMGIDFTLDMGGSISGMVTDENNDPLPGVMVLAARGSLDFEPFFTNLDVGFDTTDAQGNYHITGLSSGDYSVRTLTLISDNYSGVYLDEWYENVYNLLAFDDATPVTVTEPNETGDINFKLEKAGAISGKITGTDGSTPVLDVALVAAIDTSSTLPQLATFEYVDDNTGEYLISMLEPGDFKLFAFVDPESEGMYISEFYEGVSKFEDATVVSASLGDTTENIDFTLEQGGMIQGFVFLNPQLSTGADTLSDFPVVAFDAATGEFGGASSVSFTGGFRIPGLREGQYKLSALPGMTPYSTTYAGGGNTFDDPQSTTISVTAGAVTDQNITLEQATGSITGTVFDAESNQPANGIVLIAYDNTGHAIGAGLSGIDLFSGDMSGNPGEYIIGGLNTGSYYVRTFALFGLMQMAMSVNPGEISPEDPFSLLGSFSDLLGGNLYKDEWFDDVAVDLPELSVNFVVDLLQRLRFQGFGLLPFYQTIPGITAQSTAGITAVSVQDGSVTPNINFVLGRYGIEDLPVSVDDNLPSAIPAGFRLAQSYPNPIHRNELAQGISINFELSQAKNISISVYNVLGQKVATLLHHEMPAGFHTIRWDGTNPQGNIVPSGVYFYDLSFADGQRQMKKLVVLR